MISHAKSICVIIDWLTYQVKIPFVFISMLMTMGMVMVTASSGLMSVMIILIGVSSIYSSQITFPRNEIFSIPISMIVSVFPPYTINGFFHTQSNIQNFNTLIVTLLFIVICYAVRSTHRSIVVRQSSCYKKY